jgi:hypothetical protein
MDIKRQVKRQISVADAQIYMESGNQRGIAVRCRWDIVSFKYGLFLITTGSDKMIFKRKKKPEEGPKLTKEEMEELVDENISFARKYASEGNVSGMEMSLEVVIEYGEKIGKPISSQEIDKIKLMAFERGGKLMKERAEELQQEGKLREAQNAMKLANTYGNEAKMLRLTLQ